VQTGSRDDGTIYAVYSFSRKLGQALSSGVTGFLLNSIGYTQQTAFDENVTRGIYNITCLVPAIGYILLAAVLFFFYPLGKERVQKNAEILRKKREGKD
jgi:GPH family glycoside/pentoside/hexuronide:cation symporter